MVFTNPHYQTRKTKTQQQKVVDGKTAFSSVMRTLKNTADIDAEENCLAASNTIFNEVIKSLPVDLSPNASQHFSAQRQATALGRIPFQLLISPRPESCDPRPLNPRASLTPRAGASPARGYLSARLRLPFFCRENPLKPLPALAVCGYVRPQLIKKGSWPLKMGCQLTQRSGPTCVIT